MSDNKIRCFRCRGLKKMYKTGSAYSSTNTGGILTVCPLCLGEGKIKPLDNSEMDVDNAKSKKRSSDRRKNKTGELGTEESWKTDDLL